MPAPDWDAFEDPRVAQRFRLMQEQIRVSEARLEEARWLLENAGNNKVVGWFNRRKSWLSGHTPTITHPQYASMSRADLESALGQREEQLRRALAELEECKKGVGGMSIEPRKHCQIQTST